MLGLKRRFNMNDMIQGAIDNARAEKIQKDYEADPKNVLLRHALSRTSISDVIFEPGSLKGVDPHFSVEVKTLPVANQKASGRCWIFAGLNVLREVIAKQNKIKDFELSQNYIALFDKIEKANFALESVIALSGYSPNERTFQFILNDPVSDGGQWDMFVNLVCKYGLMPKSAFPETFQSNNTRETDRLVNAAIRHFASQAVALAKENKSQEIRKLKEETMDKIYKMFLSSFGVPPKTFDFEFTDDKGKYHIEPGYTPISFFQKYIGDSIKEYQSLINSPTEDKPFGKTFTIDYLGNVLEGKRVLHLNLTMDRIKELIIKQLKEGEVVWFGSDVGFYRDRGSFAWDDNAFDYVTPFGFDIEFDKADMLDFRHSAMNHAMVITGVDLVDGKPTKWKIENSWGSDNGIAGYYVMSDSWFTKFVYQAVIAKKYLSKEELEQSALEPIHLDPWDPMGTLAD